MRTESAGLRGLALRRKPDVELVDAAISGDPVAFSEVYRRFHTPVYAFCLSRLMRPGLAEDAAQEVFVRLLSAHPGTIAKPLSWLYGVARNVSVDIARRNDHEYASDLEHLSVVDPFDTETHVTAREDAERIVIALQGMNPRYRTALVMNEMHAQSAAEIAKALGMGLGATYTLLSRSRVAFEVSYAKAEALSTPCKHALSLVYRREGQGVSATQDLGLEQHLSACPSCAREARRVNRTHQWTALRAAFTVPALSRAWVTAAHQFQPVATWFAPEGSQSLVSSLGAAVTVAALGATVLLVPLVATPDDSALVEPRYNTVAAHYLHDDARAARAAGADAPRAITPTTQSTQNRSQIRAGLEEAQRLESGSGSPATARRQADREAGEGAGSGSGSGSGSTGISEPTGSPKQPASGSTSGDSGGYDDGGGSGGNPESGPGGEDARRKDSRGSAE